VNNLDDAVRRARSPLAKFVEERHVNPQTQHKDIWIRDPDGFVIVLAGPDRKTY
jgi:hypothetical protein